MIVDSVSAILFVDGDAGSRIVSADGGGTILTHDARSGDSIGDPRAVGAAVACLANDLATDRQCPIRTIGDNPEALHSTVNIEE